MSVAILTAVGDPRLEAELTAGLSRAGSGVQVVRRCVDLADLLAAATAGLARAVVLSADLRRLDGESLQHLHDADVAVVGLVAAGDDAAEHRLRSLGVATVLPHDVPSHAVSAAVHAAIATSRSSAADPLPALTSPPPLAAERPSPSGVGRVVAVWGPTGAPGRTTIAVNLAAELAGLGHATLLVDADSYGGSVGQLLGVLDEAAGLAAACRVANAGTLDVERLAAVALEISPALRVLTGITRAERWIEVRAAALTTVLGLARSLAGFVVVDCGFCLEQNEELSYDPAVPRRNGATLAALACADRVIGVGAADPIGLARYVRTVPDCVASTADAPLLTVANQLRPGVVGAGDARRQVVTALGRYAGVTEVHVVPHDREALDRATAAGRALVEVAPKSAARAAIRELAVRVAGGRSATRSGRRRAG